MGDYNADISDDTSLFANHLYDACKEHGLSLSSKTFLPPNSFTYISKAWHTTSWLNHCVCSQDAHIRNAIRNMEILYVYATTDRIPAAADPEN